jgi:hypothetical protein
MTMPTPAVALTIGMAEMYLSETVCYPIYQARYLADIRRSGADHTGRHGEQARRNKSYKCFGHFELPYYFVMQKRNKAAQRPQFRQFGHCPWQLKLCTWPLAHKIIHLPPRLGRAAAGMTSWILY